MFTEQEKQILLDALSMALASNKRMQSSKPQFKEVFNKIDLDINETRNKVLALKTSSK